MEFIEAQIEIKTSEEIDFVDGGLYYHDMLILLLQTHRSYTATYSTTIDEATFKGLQHMATTVGINWNDRSLRHRLKVETQQEGDKILFSSIKTPAPNGKISNKLEDYAKESHSYFEYTALRFLLLHNLMIVLKELLFLLITYKSHSTFLL